MPPFLRNLRLDTFSFWFGFVMGASLLWILGQLRKQLPRFIKFVQGSIQAIRRSLTASTEIRLRNDILRYVQSMHLAAPLFPLDDILIEPRLLPPPTYPEPGKNAPLGDMVSETIPYLPEWPELASAFNAPTLGLSEALEGEANLILLGQPGSGKSVALAYLAATLARKISEDGSAVTKIPLLVHATDFPLGATGGREAIDLLIEAVAQHASGLTLPRLPELVRACCADGRAVLLLDGLDELPPASINQMVEILGILLNQNPHMRAVVATTPDYFDGLAGLGFMPLAMAGWGEGSQAEFVNRWENAWKRSIAPEMQWEKEGVDALILNHWLLTRDVSATPLEFTLKVWAAYAGDALGPEAPKAIEAYLRRMTVNIPNARPALELLSRQMVATLTPVIVQKEAENWIYEFDQPATPGEAPAEGEPAAAGTKAAPKPAALRVMPALVANKLLLPRVGNRITFNHPVIMNYLSAAGYARMSNATAIENQPDWLGKSLTLAYLACFTDVSARVGTLVSQQGDPLRRASFTVARWLRLAPRNAPWRAPAMRHLATLLQKEQHTLGLSARAAAGLIVSGDASIAALFRQLLQSESANLRLLASLGLGILHDTKAINELAALTNDLNPLVARAAALALLGIGNKQAIDALASVMLEANEETRRTAAEALATHPEGRALLKEATHMEDILVRRAAVFGLARVPESWAKEILEKMAVEDGQWVVRNAAAGALEQSQRGNPHIPHKMLPLQDTPWLIAFAAKFGVGVMPGKPALELLIKAIKEGDEAHKLAGLEYLRLHGGEEAIVQLYNTFYGGEGIVREAAFNTLWHMAAAGVSLPPPTQFGLG